jgi:hypothetical protein
MINRLRLLFGHCHGVIVKRLNARRRLLRVRFAVNQAAAQSHGVDCGKPVVTLDINPGLLTVEDKRRLGQRMIGIDVCEAVLRADGSKGPAFTWDRDTYQDPFRSPVPIRLEADLPSVEGLLRALSKDDHKLAEQSKFRCQAV